MNENSRQLKGVLEMTIAMVISGTVGWFVVMSGQVPSTVVFWRCLFGALSMLVVCFVAGAFQQLQLSRREYCLLFVSAIALVLNWIFLFKAYSLSSIAVATITYHVEPFILVGLGALLLKENISIDKIVFLAIAFAGTILIIIGKQTNEGNLFSTTYITGILYALAAAFFYAVVAITVKQLSNISPNVIVLFQLSVGAIVLLPFSGADSWWNISGGSWGILLIIGALHTGVMCFFLYSGVQKIPTVLVGALSFIYPIVAVIVDWVAFGTTLTTLQICGSVAILLSAAGINLNWTFRKNENNQEIKI